MACSGWCSDYLLSVNKISHRHLLPLQRQPELCSTAVDCCMRSGQMSISSWIDGLPIESTAYLDPEQQPLPETALRLTRKRKALAEVSWNALPMPSSRNGANMTPLTARQKKRKQTDGADDANETPRATLELKTSSYPSFEPSAIIPGAPSCPSRSSASTSSNARSASPVKRIGDLQLIPRIITYVRVRNKTSPLPAAAEGLTSKIRKIATGKRLIPVSQKV